MKQNADGLIEWKDAVAVIHQADIKSVSQTHSLSVGISLKNGTTLRTVEPEIDAVFKEVKAAGLWGKIMVATE